MCPTIVNNVETLCNVKHIVAMGGAEFAKLGTPNNTGTRIVSLSGHVKKPGYYEIEVGKATIGELINDPKFGGGLRDGRKLKAVIPGGSSAKVFKAGEKFKLKKKDAEGKEILVETDMLDLPYDFDSLAAAGSMSGSSAIIVMDDSTDIVEALANISEFYAHESCGQCTPCREGSLWMSKALHRLTHGEGRAARRRLSRQNRRQHSRRPHDLRLRRSLLLAGAKFRREIQGRICRQRRGRRRTPREGNDRAG